MNKKRMKKLLYKFLFVIFCFLEWYAVVIAAALRDWAGYAYMISLIVIAYGNNRQWEDGYAEDTSWYWQDVVSILLALSYLIYERKVAFGVLKDFLGF